MIAVEQADRLLDLPELLHGYQLRAVQHLWDNPKAGLFMEAGIGKTAVVLSALTPEHLPALVVSTKRISEWTWPAEVKKWRPDISIAVAAGTPEKRKAALAEGADITTIGVANLKDVKPGWKTIVFDESSLFKSSSSARWKNASQLARFTEHVWLLTGTPVPNGLIDLWSQIYLLDQGERLGHGTRFNTGITQYRERWFMHENPEVKFSRFIPRSREAEEDIQSRISDICISMRTKDYLELPPIQYNTVDVPISSKTKKIYEQMRKTKVAELEQGEVTSASAGVLTGKLSQITAGFLYHDDGGPAEQIHSEKTQAVIELIEGTGSPVLVFYRFVEELEMLRKAIPEARTIKEEGVLEDWNEGKVPVLLAHPASAGHGLNAQHGGHTIIWTTLDYSQELWQQANARLHRQGQTETVMVHILQSPGTVDGKIRAVLEGKTDVQISVLDSLSQSVYS